MRKLVWVLVAFRGVAIAALGWGGLPAGKSDRERPSRSIPTLRQLIARVGARDQP
jgi:hypothetical protein